MRRVPRWLAVVAATVCAVIGFGVSPAHAAVTFAGHFTFVKNYHDPTNSRLTFMVLRIDPDRPRTVLSASWRAGS